MLIQRSLVIEWMVFGELKFAPQPYQNNTFIYHAVAAGWIALSLFCCLNLTFEVSFLKIKQQINSNSIKYLLKWIEYAVFETFNQSYLAKCGLLCKMFRVFP